MKCSSLLKKKLPGHQNLFTENTFIKESFLNAAKIMCPEHKQAFANANATRNIVAQHVKNMVENYQGKINYW